MASTGATPISLYYSATSTNVPTAGNLVAGELAINTADGKLFYKDSSGVVQVLGTKGGVGSSTTTQVLYNSSGLVVGSANMTFDGTKLTLSNDASISGLTVGKGVFTSNSGAGQVVLGDSAMVSNTSGTNNTAIGSSALNANTTAYNNVAVGFQSMYLNTTGTQNTATGFRSLRSNTTGSLNAAFGQNALYGNTTGGSNTAIGEEALQANTTASSNTAVGYQAGYSTTTATNSVMVGDQAGYSTTGSYNQFFGDRAGYNVTTGTFNHFFGQQSGYFVTTGSKNTILGAYSGNAGGLDIRTASNYIVLSDGDGNPRAWWDTNGVMYAIASLTDNTTLLVRNTQATRPYGMEVNFSAASPNNTTQSFFSGTDSTNTKVIIYSSGTISNRTGTYNTISDVKLKENIVDATPKLDKLMDVKVRNYNLIGDELKQIGFVAQELETVFPALIDNVPDLDENKQPTGEVTKGVKLTVMIPILVKAIQELKAEVDSLKQQLGK